MAHLSLVCLGPIQVKLDGQPVTSFKSNKVRALLIYLAVEGDRPHSREILANLFWPDWTSREALSNLRYSLSNLRQTINDHGAEPPFLIITRDSLQFNQASSSSIDIHSFLKETIPDIPLELGPQDLSVLEDTLAQYRGDFLEGFSIEDSAAFEEWILLKRHQLLEKRIAMLRYLATSFEHEDQYEKAQTCARQLLVVEPWDEPAHQQLMRTLALDGRRSSALAQYESCRQLLAKELGVEPSQETTRLYYQIRNGELRKLEKVTGTQPNKTGNLPAFLVRDQPQFDTPIFVARGPELRKLAEHLERASAGRGRVAFVTGEAGSGKTALIQEFGRRVQAENQHLIVASGNCNAYTGVGDPYLPFREILEMLTGNVEAGWAAGTIGSEHARRLWSQMPMAAMAVFRLGPGLVDTFVSRTGLAERVNSYNLWSERTNRPAELTVVVPGDSRGSPSPQQSDLFEQYNKVIQSIAQQGSLLLVLDDLQWADLGSISLLFHLGRHLAGSRIFILGIYRQEEVALGRDGDRHPLEAVVNEFQSEYGDIVINLNKADRRHFMESFLDYEPNRLGMGFRDLLYSQTQGHPLFSIELIRGLRERGDLVQDENGCWFEGPSLDWEKLPARVEAVIAERINRLGRPLRKALQVASVEGEVFTAEVVARVMAVEEWEIVGIMSSDLDRRHRLVRAQAIARLGSRRLSHYRFRNHLFQKYLYENLDQIERAYLHEDVGSILEELYGDQASEIAVQLAWHYQEAGISAKAVHYHHLAGQKAAQLSAYQESISHLTNGLESLAALPDPIERAEQELALLLTFGIAWQGIKSARCSEMREAYTRAYELCQQLGRKSHLCQVLGEMVEFCYVGAEYTEALKLAEESLALAQQVQDPLLVALSHWILGYISFAMGEFIFAHEHLQKMISFYEPEIHHHPSVLLRGKDGGLSAIAYDACCLWCLGYPQQAQERSQETLAMARTLGHPFSLADVLFSVCLYNEMSRDAETVLINANELIQLSIDEVPGWRGNGNCSEGIGLVITGHFFEGIEKILEGLEVQRSINVQCYTSNAMTFVAEAQAKSGSPQEALITLADTSTFIENTNERYWEAELHRLKGRILLMQEDESQAEASLQKAIDVARRQEAKMLELRAATDLARLWKQQGKAAEARQILERIYSWFSEGFDTEELKAAEVLLRELS